MNSDFISSIAGLKVKHDTVMHAIENNNDRNLFRFLSQYIREIAPIVKAPRQIVKYMVQNSFFGVTRKKNSGPSVYTQLRFVNISVCKC